MFNSSTSRAEATLISAAACAAAFLRTANSVWARSASACEPCPARANAAVNSDQLFGMAERVLGNGLLLKRRQEVEIRRGHEEEEIVVRGRGRVLPGGHFVAGDAGLEDRVRGAKVGRHAGNRWRAAANGLHSHAGFECRAAADRDCPVVPL